MKNRWLARGAVLLLLSWPFSARAQNEAANTAPEIPVGMVLVAAGEFTMGSENSEPISPNTPRGFNDSRPRHKESTPAFFIDKTEVTNAQYQEYCKATGYPVPPGWKNNGSFATGEEEFPVTHVTWFEAVAYAAWAGKRLPTEIEWEKAARGTDGREYPWGNNWDPRRVIVGRSRSSKVAQFPSNASPFGALDMAGNVFEWTQSWYDAYPNATIKFPEYGEVMKVIRGGGFDGGESLARTYYRSVAFPATRSEWIGFRCVQDVK
jgi:formylglycine-generating enzyme required for sulfatase activity